MARKKKSKGKIKIESIHQDVKYKTKPSINPFLIMLFRL